MLLIGNGCITHDEERTQMAIWCISASPLIMGPSRHDPVCFIFESVYSLTLYCANGCAGTGNDMRNVSAESRAILMNKHAVAVSQDPLGQMGIRLSPNASATQVWARVLANGDMAVALYNKAENAKGPRAGQPPIPGPPCTNWTHTTGGYWQAVGGTPRRAAPRLH